MYTGFNFNFSNSLFRKAPQEWYTVADGDWSNPAIWASNGVKRKAGIPKVNDNVTISHNISVGATSYTVKNLTVYGKLIHYGNTIAITGKFVNCGVIDGNSSNPTGNQRLDLFGDYNVFSDSNFVFGNNYCIAYCGYNDQYILPITYKNFAINTLGSGRSSTKFLTGNTTITGSCDLCDYHFLLYGYAGISAGSYNLTFNGQVRTAINNTGNIQSWGGTITFNGLARISHYGLYSVGNSIVVFKNGLILDANDTLTWGDSTVIFDGTQSVSGVNSASNTTIPSTANVTIADNSVITFDTMTCRFLCPITAGGANSKIVNKATICHGHSGTFFSGGIKDLTTYANTLVYNYNGNSTVDNYNFYNLGIGGTGTKTITNDLTINSLVGYGGTIDFGSANVTLNGQLINSSGNINIKKTGAAGLTIIKGGATVNTITSWDFSSANTNVEFWGGTFAMNSNAASSFKSGTGTYTFKAANQTVDVWNYGLQFDGPVIVEGAITVNITGGQSGQFSVKNTVNGTVAGSTLRLDSGASGGTQLVLNNNNQPMTTGSLVLNGNGNGGWLTYNYNGDGSIWDYNYVGGLQILGSGNKTPIADLQTLTLGGSGTIELSSYSLTMNGALSGNLTLKKNSSTGLVILKTGMTGPNTFTGNLDFSVGNPSVEVWSGSNLQMNFTDLTKWKTGTGTWIFKGNTTLSGYGNGIKFDCVAIVDSGATITNVYTGSPNAGGVIFTHSLNGVDETSAFTNQGYLEMQVNSKPMQTGTLTFSGANNSFGYNFSTNVDLWHSSYNNLVLKTGNKTVNSDTTVSGTIYFNGVALYLNDNNITLGSLIVQTGSGTLIKSGNSGSTIITGSSSTATSFLFTGTAPVEFRNGFSTNPSAYNDSRFNGPVSFTTNNQTINAFGAGVPFYGAVTIGAGIKLTLAYQGATSTGTPNILFDSPVDGLSSTSELVIDANLTQYKGIQQPMNTGLLTKSATNTRTFEYVRSGDQDVKAGNYNSLKLSGSGNKTMQGNVNVAGAYSVTGTVARVDNGYTFNNP